MMLTGIHYTVLVHKIASISDHKYSKLAENFNLASSSTQGETSFILFRVCFGESLLIHIASSSSFNVLFASSDFHN